MIKKILLQHKRVTFNPTQSSKLPEPNRNPKFDYQKRKQMAQSTDGCQMKQSKEIKLEKSNTFFSSPTSHFVFFLSFLDQSYNSLQIIYFTP
jgi:exonuclease V gamma subunit